MLKRFLISLLFLANGLFAWSQDTTVVQTLTFASTTRSGTFQFPLDTATWAKIVMQYRMRCKNALISTQSAPNQGCGEWDYSCNTYITDSSRLDSVKATHSNYTISNFSGNTYPYTNSPTYSFIQYQQQAVTYDSVLNETLSAIGTGTMVSQYPLASGNTSGKSQYLWTASELAAAGLVAGDIQGLSLDLSNVGAAVEFLRIKIKATNLSGISEIDLSSGWQQVYFLNTTFPANGLQRLNFYQPFNWDGVSNLLVEINYNNANQNINNLVNTETAPANTAITSMSDDYYVSCDGFDDYINAGDIDELDGATQFTYEGWVNIRSWRNWVNIFGKNGKTLLQTGDVAGNLYCIIRNPTNDYGYATGVLPMNTWTHVAMTYDGSQATNADRLKLYINGVQITLTFNGTIPATTDISTAPLRMGDIAGDMDDARVWKTALSATTIADGVRKRIDSSHPNFADLLLNYEMNQTTGNTIFDLSGNGRDADLPNGGMWYKFNGNRLFKNLMPTPERPNVNFVQGTYVTTIDTITVLDSTVNQPNTVISYQVQNNNLQAIDTTTHWLASYAYIKDETGAVVDSVLYPAMDTLNIATLNYFNKWPQKLELISFVTPYGKGLDLGVNGKMWEYDVTDFAPVLKGKKYLNMQWGGEWQEDIDIRFLFIKGTPPRNVLSIEQIWPVTAEAYAQISSNARYEPRSITLNSDADYFKIRSAITGHGQQGEFIQRQHYINLNGGANDFQWYVWKECALNPVYPQGGTWVYDRAGWCPGMATDMKEMDVTTLVTPGQPVTIDYGVSPATGDSRYIVNNQLVQYDSANFSLDAAVEEILKPTDLVQFGRNNPVCMKPVVRIKNTGATPLTSLKIEYGMEGQPPVVQQWSGGLYFLQTADVVLNTYNWSSVSGKFVVKVSEPNGGVDMYADNDIKTSDYTFPGYLPGKIVITFKANNKPYENEYTVKDQNGATVFSNGSFTANALYDDTLVLAPGCYEIHLPDYGNDGLQWWANTSQGAGYFRIKDETGAILKNFNPDCGAEIRYQFSVKQDVGNEAPKELDQTIMEVYPNPTSGLLSIKANFVKPKAGNLTLVDLYGKTLLQHNFQATTFEHWQFDTRHLAKGMYLVVCKVGNEITTQKVVVE